MSERISYPGNPIFANCLIDILAATEVLRIVTEDLQSRMYLGATDKLVTSCRGELMATSLSWGGDTRGLETVRRMMR